MEPLPASPTLKRKASALGRPSSPSPLELDPLLLPQDIPPTGPAAKKQRLRFHTPPAARTSPAAPRPRPRASKRFAGYRRSRSLPVSSSLAPPANAYDGSPPRPANPTAAYSPAPSTSSLPLQQEQDYDSDSEYYGEYAADAMEVTVTRRGHDELDAVQRSNVCFPPSMPLITLHTVRQWDFEQLASNPQFRHDLLLDPALPFSPPPQTYEQKLLSDTYWTAIQRELATGCTCTSFDPVRGSTHDCFCTATATPTNYTSMVGLLSGTQLAPPSVRFPDRLPRLVAAIRDVLHSVMSPPMPPTWLPPPPGHPQYAQYCQLLQNPGAAPCEPEPLADPLPPIPDPPFDSFDAPAYFRALTHVLTQHCAPCRDPRVAELVELVDRGELVLAMKHLLELGEQMKIDIVNYERMRLRDHFYVTAPSFEAQHLLSTLVPPHITGKPALRLVLPNTHLWLASLPGLPSPSPFPRLPAHKHAATTLANAVTHLLLSYSCSPAHLVPALPETLRLSRPFLATLTPVLRDAFALALLFYHYRTLAHLPLPNLSAFQRIRMRKKPTLDYATLKHQLAAVSSLRLGGSTGDEHAYKENVRSALLLVRTLADDARGLPRSPARAVPSAKDLAADEAFFFSALSPPSPSSGADTTLAGRARTWVLTKLRLALLTSASAHLFPRHTRRPKPRDIMMHAVQDSEWDLRSTLLDAGAGLEHLAHELGALGERAARLVEVHAHVWAYIYEGERWL